MVDDIRAPAAWRRPKTKIYDYNQDMGCAYYKPMIDYVDTKERQGIFFERPTEKIHLPHPAELVMMSHETGGDQLTGTGNLERFLVKAYAGQAKESNTATAKTRMKMLTTVTAMKALPHTQLDNQQTAFDSVRLKKGAPLGQMTRNYYTQELGVLKNSKDFVKHTQAQHLDEVMCGVYRNGGSGYGGPAADEKFFDPERQKWSIGGYPLVVGRIIRGGRFIETY